MINLEISEVLKLHSKELLSIVSHQKPRYLPILKHNLEIPTLLFVLVSSETSIIIKEHLFKKEIFYQFKYIPSFIVCLDCCQKYLLIKDI